MNKENKILNLSFFIFLFLGIFSKNFILFLIFYLFFASIIIAISNMTNKNKQIPNIETNIIPKCPTCGTNSQVTDNFCRNCGTSFIKSNTILQPKIAVNQSNFDPIFAMDEEKMIEEFIERQLIKAGINKNANLFPEEILKRKQILNAIFSVLVFAFVFLIFFHLPLYFYVIGFLILYIFYRKNKKFDIVKYIKKEIKARPNEKITNIIMNIKTNLIVDNTKNMFLISFCLSIIIPLLIFWNPKILYEKVDNGYAVRFYTFGVTNFTTATIPKTHNGEKIVSMRGNVFSNMYFLKTVTLPDSITEIRGQAFKNDKSLTTINIPKNLEYLGGGAFYNCSSLVSIELPNSVTFIGGEAFYNAESLESIKLSNKITEIRGNTFENCSSLKNIIIPSSVIRIGGHAFYGCSSLSSVTLYENSRLNEIGSSAFRNCPELYEITVPIGTYINERAFKESPTTIKTFKKIYK